MILIQHHVHWNIRRLRWHSTFVRSLIALASEILLISRNYFDIHCKCFLRHNLKDMYFIYLQTITQIFRKSSVEFRMCILTYIHQKHFNNELNSWAFQLRRTRVYMWKLHIYLFVIRKCLIHIYVYICIIYCQYYWGRIKTKQVK